MDVIIDSWHVLVRQGGIVAPILACAGWGAVLIAAALRKLNAGLDPADQFALAVSGWLVPALTISSALFLLGVFASVPVAVAGLAVIVTTTIAAARSWIPVERGTVRRALVPAALLLFFLILRLAYIHGTLLPPYFDSAEHYRLTRALAAHMAPPHAGPWGWPAPAYYHLGFHLSAAALSAALGVDPNIVILVLGQVILACIPIPFFFIVRRISGSYAAGVIALALAGFGWYMPAHAVDWGKYPALASLLAVQPPIYLAYLRHAERGVWQKSPLLRFLLVSGVAASFFMHTRSLILLAIVIGSWAAAGRWAGFSFRWRLTTLLILIGLIAILGGWTGRDAFLLALDPYLGNGFLITGFVLLPAPFAFKSYPRHACCSLLCISLMMGSLLITLPRWVPGIGGHNLLDRPFVEMTLFMPLVWLAGLGCAGLLRAWREYRSAHGAAQLALTQAGFALLLCALLAVHASARYGYRPSKCCRIVGYDDVAALDWLGANLPPDAVVGIAAAELTVLSGLDPVPSAGTDAGVWIAPMGNAGMVLVPHGLDFSREAALHQLCARNIGYIYRGGMLQSFDATALDRRPEWYRSLFRLPDAQIYEITGCPATMSKGLLPPAGFERKMGRFL